MLATYAATAAVCVSALAIGQAALALCGIPRSWISAPVGLALLSAICWGTVRLPGDGVVSAIAVSALTVAALAFLANRGVFSAERDWAPAAAVGLVALIAASLPFLVEGHFGILGTGFNPDMSQHLLTADRLAGGHSSELVRQGYPLGPHGIVVALNKGLGIGLVQGFSGITVGIAVLAPLTALVAFRGLPAMRRGASALVVGLAYLVASYYAQGAFKETMQALFVLAFVLALREATRDPGWRDRPPRFVPAAVIAVGSVYSYSFPGLIWLAAAAIAWAAAELAIAGFGSPTTRPAAIRPLSLAFAVFAVGALPELGRMIEFHNFETFDPNGPGLGNLFGQVSPFTALGIWPSGDFRLAPGDGAVPAVAYYLGAAFASALLLWAFARSVRRRDLTLPGVAVAMVGIYLAARLGGTPYTAAKALEIAAPILALLIVTSLPGWPFAANGKSARFLGRDMADKGTTRSWGGDLAGASATLYLLAAGFCSVLAFANAPVGPTGYSPQLTGLRPLIAADSTLVLAPRKLLDEEHGERYVAWELRGGRVCISAEDEAGSAPPAGVRFVITWAPGEEPPYPGLTLRRDAGPYLLWERPGPVAGHSPCPLIAVRQARQGT